MKINKLLPIFLIFVVNKLFAQDVPQMTHAEFLGYTRQLFVKGNECYANIGNKAELRRIIDSYQNAIDQRREAGLLSKQTDDSLMHQVNKLTADFHYLNTDEESVSYQVAKYYFMQCLNFANDPAHRQYQDINHDKFILHRELSQLYYKQKRYLDAYAEMLEAYKMASKYLSPYDDEVLDIISQLAICKARVSATESDFDEAIELIDHVIEQYHDTLSDDYGEVIRKKAKILMLHQELRKKDADNETIRLYIRYFTRKKNEVLRRFPNMNAEDREQYWMRIRSFVVDCYRLENAAPTFLYDVTLFSKALLLDYALHGTPGFVTWRQIQHSLKTDDCAIEFVQYEKCGVKQLGALVLKKHGRPCFVRIGNADEIKDRPLANEDGTVYEAITGDMQWLQDDLYTDTLLFRRIWNDELLKAIGKDTKRVYFAADGIFHQMAIEYMFPNVPELTSLTTHDIYRLSSTRQLVTPSTTKLSNKVLMCGGINFGVASPHPEEEAEGLVPNDNLAYEYMKSMNAYFGPLPGTYEETAEIHRLLDSLRFNSLFVSDSIVTETYFSEIAKEYPIVHVATHGCYAATTPEGTDLKPATYDESLSQSMIALAGINTNLNKEDFDISRHDGILSAREFSQMDLHNIDLIVLSACQTGLGNLSDDGVYGLQRGLKNAGVKGMVLSLWSVDDEATSLLMQRFYTNLLTEDVHTAFMHARDELIATGKETERQFDPVLMKGIQSPLGFGTPHFYNAFILIDIK